MKNIQLPKIKVCCIQTIEEAHLAIRYGASALGLVSETPSGPGEIPEATIKEIIRSLPPGISSFLLTTKNDLPSIIAQLHVTKPTTIQICDSVDNSFYFKINEEFPHLKIVQVIHVIDQSSIVEAKNKSPLVDAILLDSGNPNLAVKELGGTGRTHDWELSAQICRSIDKPVFLAGGLNSQNVAKAFNSVLPFGLDLCSSLRSDGKLDEAKLRKFMITVQSLSR